MHAVDELVISDAVSVGCHQHHGAEQRDLFVGQLHRVDPLGEFEGGIDQESGVGSVLDRVASHELPVEADDGVHGGVEHSNQPHEKGVKEPGFQQSKFIALRQQLEAGNFSGEFDNAADDISKTLREFLLGLYFGRGVQGACLEVNDTVSFHIFFRP